MQPPFEQWYQNMQQRRERASSILLQLTPLPPIDSIGRWHHQLRELSILYHEEIKSQHDELHESRIALEAALEKYTELYDSAPIGYLTLDDNGIILEANLMAAKLLGMDRHTLLGSMLYHVLPDRKNKDQFYLHCNRAFATGDLESCSLTMQRSDGTTFLAHLDSHAIHTDQRQLYTALSDMSLYQKMELDTQLAQAEERALRVLCDALEQRVLERTEELQLMNKRLMREIAERKQLEAQMIQAQKMQAIGTLAGGIAHEFNNVLAVILGYAQLLQNDLQPYSTSLHYLIIL